MRDLQTTAFNKRLYDSIVNLEELVNKHINPENIKYFSPKIIKKIDTLLELKYRYDNRANINGFHADKLNSMVNYLNVASVEYKVIDGEFEIDYKADNDILTQTIRIPEGFDGRNGFFSYTLRDPHSRHCFGTNVLNANVNNHDEEQASIMFIQTERNVVCKFSNISYKDYVYHFVYSMVLWRYK